MHCYNICYTSVCNGCELKADIDCLTYQWRRQDFVTGGSEVWVYRGSRVRSTPEADTFTAVHREFVGFGTV